MFGTCKHLIGCLLLIALGQQTYAQDFDPSSYCVLVPENFNFADVEECSIYYTCVNGVAQQKSCPANQYYNKNTKQCTTSASACSVSNDPCAGTAGEAFKPLPGNCQGYVYCKNGQFVGTGTCPNNLNFVNGKCTYDSCPSTGSTQLDSLCQIFPIDVYFGSFDNCAEYQICRAGNFQPTNGTCATEQKPNYVYDVKISKCNILADGMCDGRGSGNTPSTPTGPCPKAGDTTYDSNVCSMYYKCAADGGAWQSQKCPAGEYYDLVSGTCKPRQSALTYYSCDRCEGTTSTFVNAVDPDCSQYLYCVDGTKKSASECTDERFFNEGLGACIKNPTMQETYEVTHAACAPCECALNADSECTDKYGRPAALCPCTVCDDTGAGGTTPDGTDTTVDGGVTEEQVTDPTTDPTTEPPADP